MVLYTRSSQGISGLGKPFLEDLEHEDGLDSSTEDMAGLNELVA